MASGDIIHIDGSHGEGGGQILRTALTLSVLLQRPIRIEKVRAGREKPGLAPQHLTCVRAAAEICGAEVEGDRVSSQEIEFRPGPACSGDYRFDIGTAGSTSLVFQTIFLPLAMAAGPSHLTLIGGTHVPWSPCTHYLEHIYLPAVRRMGFQARIDLQRWGWFPRGGGIVAVAIEPCRGPRPLGELRNPSLNRIWGISAVSNLPDSIAERQRRALLRSLEPLGARAEIRIERGPSIGQGTLVFLSAEMGDGMNGFAALGRRGKPAEEVGREAGESLLAFLESGAAVDPHLADQLILPMALAEGNSAFTTPSLTSHLETVLWLVSRFLPGSFEVQTGEIVLVKCLM